MSDDSMTDERRSSVAAVKARVAASFESSDSRVIVRSTEYFNNTYSPDLVLTWPGSAERRLVFLRADSNPAYLQQDIHLLGNDDHSILMPLAASRETEDTEMEQELQQVSARRKVLVANADSLDELSTSKNASPYSGLVSRAILQGGRGVIRKNRASSITKTVTEAFLNASQASSESIEEAVHEASLALDTPRSNSINSFMQALWLASGETIDTFPVTVPSLPSLDATSLSFLLEMDELDDDEFWQRLGVGVDIEAIIASGVSGSPANLQRLMKSNAGRLRARVCRVTNSNADRVLGLWFLGDGGLGLDIGSHSAIFTNSRVGDLDLEGIDATQTVLSVGERATASGVRVLAMSLAGKDSRLEYAGIDGFDISRDPNLSNIASALGSSAQVVSVTTAVGAANRRLICDLPSSTGRGVANAKYFLSEMALNALPLFVPLQAEALDALKVSVGHVDMPLGSNASVTEYLQSEDATGELDATSEEAT